MRRLFPVILLFLVLSLHPIEGVKAAPRSDQVRTPGQIIALINAYRAENGLPAYQHHGTLMLTAQGQSDYQASINAVTHEGPGGTRPRDRAYAAGYGDGQIIFISEIIYGATSAGPDTAVSWWKTSQIHNDTMLATQYVHIGAGVAESGGRFYYTAVTGVPAGGEYVPSTSSGDEGDTVSEPVLPVIPIVVATPQEDGSVLHIVRSGQTLWAISAIYEVDITQLLELNNLLLTSFIFPGDELYVQAASEPTPTDTQLPPTLAPTPTLTVQASASNPQLSGTQSASSVALVENIDSEDALLAEDIEEQNSGTRTAVAIVLLGLAMVIVASFFILPTTQESSESEDPLNSLN